MSADPDEPPAAFTGNECHDHAGGRQGDQYTVQGNILENVNTVDAMAATFEETDGGLPERLTAALHAGNAAGGDKRGGQSAALYVAKPEGGYDGRNDRWVDVRVDDHERPIDELARVFNTYDVALLEREAPEETRELTGETATAAASPLVELGFHEGDPTAEFGGDARDALETFRGMNNFENHSLAVLADAVARGWDAAEPDAGPEKRLVDAIRHGLSRLDRV